MISELKLNYILARELKYIELAFNTLSNNIILTPNYQCNISSKSHPPYPLNLSPHVSAITRKKSYRKMPQD